MTAREEQGAQELAQRPHLLSHGLSQSRCDEGQPHIQTIVVFRLSARINGSELSRLKDEHEIDVSPTAATQVIWLISIAFPGACWNPRLD